jgi:hypothetical protein
MADMGMCSVLSCSQYLTSPSYQIPYTYRKSFLIPVCNVFLFRYLKPLGIQRRKIQINPKIILWSSGTLVFKGSSLCNNLVYCFISFPLIPYSYGVEVFIFLWIYTLLVRLLGRVIGLSQCLYINTEQHKHIKTHTHRTAPNIHALSGIRTHDHGVRVSENSSCLRPLDYRVRP